MMQMGDYKKAQDYYAQSISNMKQNLHINNSDESIEDKMDSKF